MEALRHIFNIFFIIFGILSVFILFSSIVSIVNNRRKYKSLREKSLYSHGQIYENIMFRLSGDFRDFTVAAVFSGISLGLTIWYAVAVCSGRLWG